MFSTLRSIYHFFRKQALYPLIIASGLCLALFLARVLYTGRFAEYRNLVWNLVLAWIPYSLSIIALIAHLKIKRFRWILVSILGTAWLFFFPNAPYLVTDFLHLSYRPPVPLWYDIGLIASYTLTGFWLGLISLQIMHSIVKKATNWFVGWSFAICALGLGGLGIYLGRFGRFNSWDLLINPIEILKTIVSPILNPRENLSFIGFTLMFTAILVVFYLLFTTLNRNHNEE